VEQAAKSDTAMAVITHIDIFKNVAIVADHPP
jgi:hypothetical protein